MWFFIFYLYGDLLVELNISNQVVIFCSMKGKAWHVHAILFFTYAPLQAYQSRHFHKKTISGKIMVRDSNNVIVLVGYSTEVSVRYSVVQNSTQLSTLGNSK